MDATSDLIKILCQESSTQTSSDLELDVIELQDVEFGRAVMLSEKNTEGIDILIRLHDIVLDGIKDAIQPYMLRSRFKPNFPPLESLLD
ncbi:hypothetical protein COL26b_005736 [Colletotrichum chrysophilum]|uniref:uncharacterized protein n=1 Tax=Colletotrichum chrysophilum TaxID=1836956 RepID=UPI00230197C1|nr:uncharacterized protein COL26b_005736 [Colletotrichum chrysophilum]KAJ0375944.1 hypothetical protein COL26b_005736 [Colletotrichum chrysophilum]